MVSTPIRKFTVLPGSRFSYVLLLTAGCQVEQHGYFTPMPGSAASTATVSSSLPSSAASEDPTDDASGIPGGSSVDSGMHSAPQSPDAAHSDATQSQSPDAASSNAIVSPLDAGQVGSGMPDSQADVDASVTPVSLSSDLALLLTMDEVAWVGAPGEVLDSSVHANNGTIEGTPQLTTGGRYGGAGLFDGSMAIRVPDAPSLRPSGALTLSAWIYPLDITASDSFGIINKRAGYNDRTSFAFYVQPDAALACDIQLENDRFASHGLVPLDTWTHVALVFDGTQGEEERSRVYINGTLDRTARESSALIEPYTADVLIGNLIGGGGHFIGRIDETAIWTRALRDAEIATIAQSEASLVSHLTDP